MCGVAGYLGVFGSGASADAQAVLRRMGDTLQHRGPDDAGYWWDAANAIGLAHRRLSVVDLSPAGHQPMESPSGQYVIVFNGEIYNHQDLRDLLEGKGAASWRGHSDTETLLAGLDAWGVEETLKRSIGMFAFAVWDRETATVVLARDRVGEKPLYYGWQGNAFLFGSELRSLRVHPAFKAPIDRQALTLLLQYNYIPAPHSIYQGIAKLSPGSLLKVSLRQRDPEVRLYWSGASAARAGLANPFSGSAEEAIEHLEALLKDAVRRQMIADVPLGAFLSGGVDSSTVVALMQAQSPRPVRTFSIGFHEARYNEAEHAKLVARHLQTDHTEEYVTADAARAVIPRLPELYDEPFADSSQIPAYLVSRIARQRVTVSLSGDAGDELFGGYNRYALTQSMWRWLSVVPVAVRKLAAGALTAIPPQAWDNVSGAAGWALPRAARLSLVGDKVHKGAAVLASASPSALYMGLVSHRSDPAAVVNGGREPTTQLTGGALDLDILDGVDRMMAVDLLTYLPDDILVKVDRAAMAVSLETRGPFLDHRVVEFAWRLPRSLKLRDGQTKWLLRQVLYRHVPKELIERPKMGFGVPLDEWMRGPLREWVEALLDEKRLQCDGYLNPAPIRAKWADHLSGHRNWAHHLWGVLMFQAWLDNERGKR